MIESARKYLMSRPRPVLIGAGAVSLLLVVLAVRGFWSGAVAQAPGQRPVSVEVAKAVRTNVPYRIEALGTVTTVASVAIKTRVDTEIVAVHFTDGARVNAGDVLFTLDGRQIEAEIKRVQAVIDGAEATLQQSLRDVERYTDLVAKSAAPIVTLNNAQTQVNVSRSLAESNKATLESLKVQLGFCTIRAPISGRVSTASVKVGNFVRQADVTPLAVINQIAPIYVTYAVPQRNLPDVRRALAAETATIDAIIPGEPKRAHGQVSVIENTVDPSTGMVMIRATMPNADELLWPGMLVTVQMTLRIEEEVVVPSVAVQASQAGSFVFVVKEGAAVIQPIKVARTIDNLSVISQGLQGDEVVVTDGHLQLQNKTRVAPRAPKAGS